MYGTMRVVMPRVLVVDDETTAGVALGQGLQAEGMEVLTAVDGPSGLRAARTGSFDVILLDAILPGLSGYQVLWRLRADGDDTPVLLFSWNDSDVDLAGGFDLGADGHFVKPFSFMVLLAQIRALLRRRSPDYLGVARPPLRVGHLIVDRASRQVSWAGRAVQLSPLEYAIVQALASRPGAVWTKGDLLRVVWGDEHAVTRNAVEVYVSYLRRKLAAVGADQMVNTVRGCGYRLGTLDPGITPPSLRGSTSR